VRQWIKRDVLPDDRRPALTSAANCLHHRKRTVTAPVRARRAPLPALQTAAAGAGHGRLEPLTETSGNLIGLARAAAQCRRVNLSRLAAVTEIWVRITQALERIVEQQPLRERCLRDRSVTITMPQ
jgi:hypothetical protein